jgi:hypothetical protein
MKKGVMPTGAALLGEFEVHSPAGIQALLAAGVGPTEPIKGKRPIDALIEMYLRSSRFADCYCRPMIRVRSLLWGESMSWETVVHDITPISYAQCGLYRQFHRQEEDVYSNIDYLSLKRYGMKPALRNVPNKYLAGEHWSPLRGW